MKSFEWLINLHHTQWKTTQSIYIMYNQWSIHYHFCGTLNDSLLWFRFRLLCVPYGFDTACLMIESAFSISSSHGSMLLKLSVLLLSDAIHSALFNTCLRPKLMLANRNDSNV